MLLGDLAARHSRSRPDRRAVWFPDVGEGRTWRELADRSNRLASAMQSLAGPGDRVAILAENCPEYFECYLGVPDAGRVLTLLNYRLHPAELAWILEDCGATVLVAQAPYARMVQDLCRDLPALRHVVVIGERVAGTRDYEDVLGAGTPERRPAADDGDPAWVVYTSGTTGRPKGAVLSHRNLVTSVLQSVVHYAPAPDERFLNAFPLCHVAGYMALVQQFRGGTVVQQSGWDPERWVRTVEELRVTCGGMAPTMLRAVLDVVERTTHDLSSLRALGYGSAPMPLDVLRRAVAAFGPVLFTGFGMTELAGNALALDREAHARAAGGDAHLLASAGSVMCMAEARIVDPAGEDCAVGDVGELVVRGDQTMLGYLDGPEATAEAYRGGWLHTGDLARFDHEGYVYIVDRAKDMIVSGGENVYSVEVEDALSAHPDVLDVAVVGVADERWGETVAAAVVVRPGRQVTAEDLVGFCRQRLAGYKRPRHVLFVDEIPKSVVGKARKHDLRGRFGPTTQVGGPERPGGAC